MTALTARAFGAGITRRWTHRSALAEGVRNGLANARTPRITPCRGVRRTSSGLRSKFFVMATVASSLCSAKKSKTRSAQTACPKVGQALRKSRRPSSGQISSRRRAQPLGDAVAEHAPDQLGTTGPGIGPHAGSTSAGHARRTAVPRAAGGRPPSCGGLAGTSADGYRPPRCCR
jgi:hypothetical protein